MLLSIRSHISSRASPTGRSIIDRGRALTGLAGRFRTAAAGCAGGFVRGWRHARGQGLVEYALILVLVAIVVIAALTVLGDQVYQTFDRVSCVLGGGEWHTDQGNQKSGKCKGAKRKKKNWGGGNYAGTDRIIAQPAFTNYSL